MGLTLLSRGDTIGCSSHFVLCAPLLCHRLIWWGFDWWHCRSLKQDYLQTQESLISLTAEQRQACSGKGTKAPACSHVRPGRAPRPSHVQQGFGSETWGNDGRSHIGGFSAKHLTCWGNSWWAHGTSSVQTDGTWMGRTVDVTLIVTHRGFLAFSSRKKTGTGTEALHWLGTWSSWVTTLNQWLIHCSQIWIKVRKHVTEPDDSASTCNSEFTLL